MAPFKRAVALAASLLLLFVFLRRNVSSRDAPISVEARLRQIAAEEALSTPPSDAPLHSTLSSSTKYDIDPLPEYPSSANTHPLSPYKPKQILLGDISNRPLRTRLSYYFPYDAASKFPNYIWQTWKVQPSSGDFADRLRTMEATWTEKHPDFIHEVLSDELAVNVLRHLYSGLPDVLDAYEALPRPVLKADFFRYLILLARGGIYSDIDTAVLQSAVDWIPAEVPRESYGLVIGIEADPDREDWADWYSRRIQFCQWTIQSKPGHPVLREIVAKITESTLEKRRLGQLNHDDVHNVVDFTGPAIWTDTIFDFFNDERYFDFPEDHLSQEDGGNITWKHFTGMTEPRRVGDVIILPITSFSPGIQTMGAGEDDDPMAFVKHFFEGAWKPENERHIGEQA